MKYIFMMSILAVMSSCTAKKTTHTRVGIIGPDSTKTIEGNKKQDVPGLDPALPVCIKKLIHQFEKEEIQSPPRSIYRYSYNGKPVYFVPAICCDFFSDLYDENCSLIAHPDGGFTGRGDGRVSDFMKTRTNEKLIWKDERK